jgi:hypothetical protein
MTTSQLVDCPRCRRHFFVSQGSCPFCERVGSGRVARFAVAALTPMVLGACYGSPKDSGDTGFSTTGPQPTIVGDISGKAGVLIVEANCDVAWDMTGTQCDGCELGWDATLTLNDEGSCEFGEDTTGVFEVLAGAAYWKGSYWGAATSGGNSVNWATAGYVYGAGGYTYVYSGSASY